MAPGLLIVAVCAIAALLIGLVASTRLYERLRNFRYPWDSE